MPAQTPTQIAESLDYFNPVMSARIITRDGQHYPLWTGGSAQTVGFDVKTHLQGLSGDLNALAFLTELTVELNLGGIPKITAVLGPPLQDTIKLIDTDLLEIGSNRLQVMLGYASGGEGKPILQPFEGMLSELPHVSIGAACTVSIVAQGFNGAVASTTETAGETFKDMTRLEMLTAIGDRYGFEFNIDDAASDSDAFNTLTAQKLTRTMGWQTPIWFLTQLLIEARCFMIWSGSPSANGKQQIRVMSRIAAFARQTPAFLLSLFNFGSNELLGKNVFPILGLQTTPGMIFTTGIQKVVMREVDALKKTLSSKEMTAKDAQAGQTAPGPIDAKGGESPLIPKAATATWGGQHVAGDPAETSAIESATAFFDVKALSMGVPLDIDTIGLPTVVPGMLVQIRGLGKKLDNNYMVFNVTHTLNTSGYTTHLHIIANTQAALEAQARNLEPGPQNTNVVPEGSDKTNVQPQGGQ
jgi:hypothetical protein